MIAEQLSWRMYTVPISRFSFAEEKYFLVFFKSIGPKCIFPKCSFVKWFCEVYPALRVYLPLSEAKDIKMWKKTWFSLFLLQMADPLLALTLGRMFTSHMVLQAEPQVSFLLQTFIKETLDNI